MEPKLSELIYIDMERTYSPKLELIHRLYSNGPLVPSIEIMKWTDIADWKKIYRTLQTWEQLGLIEKDIKKDDKTEGGMWLGYRVKPEIASLIEDNFKKNVNYENRISKYD